MTEAPGEPATKPPAPRTLGVEEELFLVDPESRQVSPRSREVLRLVLERESAGGDLDHELLQHQLETRTSPAHDLADLRKQLVSARRIAADAAAAAGLVTVASGTYPGVLTADPRITRDDRYLAMQETYGEIARASGTCGMHVHVQIDSDEQGVAVIDAITPWLPVVLALSANSPFHEGQDTRHASWRSQMWTRWPSAGPTEPFGSVETYRRVGRALVASGAARDEGMLYFDARLSVGQPTVEIRVSDVCTDPDDAVLIAALVRGLVARAIRVDDAAAAPWRAEVVRAAQWRAARYGLSDRLLDPLTAAPTPARDVLGALVAAVRDDLEAAGDAELVDVGVARALAASGASRQRAAYERGGGEVSAVVDDLAARTNLAGAAVSP